MIGSIVSWLTVIVLGAIIVFVGWNEPIKYRFMSRKAIEELERPPATPAARARSAAATPAAAPTPPWMWDSKRRTLLDSGPSR